MENLQVPFEFESCQVVSFLAPNVQSCKSCYFDYGNFGKENCLWFDHGPNEFPQLLILSDNFLEVEFEVTNLFFQSIRMSL